MSKKIMILGASILQLPAIQKAKEMGLRVVVVDMNEEAVGFQENGIEKEVISTIDIPSVIAVARKHKIDGVMTLASDLPMRTVAAVARECNLVGIDEATALRATNKAEMRRALKEYGVPIPEFHSIYSREQYDEAVSTFVKRVMKFIVKPADNSGSRGIYLVEDPCNSASINMAFHRSKENSRGGEVLVEEYMEGPEVSVETLCVDGDCHIIQITDKLTTGAPYFVEMGHSQPTKLGGGIVDKIRGLAQTANKAIGIVNGPSHTEIIVTEEGPKIVEIGARLGGDCITTHLVPLSTGVDMVECCIKIALGDKPDINQKFIKGSAIRFFYQNAGTIKSVNGVEEAMKREGIKQISFMNGVGAKIKEVASSTDRIGFVIAHAETADLAVALCEQTVEQIQIKIV